jgi:hypothetical protein
MLFIIIEQIKYFVLKTRMLLQASCASGISDVRELRCGHPCCVRLDVLHNSEDDNVLGFGAVYIRR